MEKMAFIFEFGYIIFRELGKPHSWTFPHLIYHIYKSFILLYCLMTLHKYRNIENSIKGKYAEKKAKGGHQACFSLFYLSLI